MQGLAVKMKLFHNDNYQWLMDKQMIAAYAILMNIIILGDKEAVVSVC